MKQILMTISILLSLSAVAAENEQTASQDQKQETAQAANSAAQQPSQEVATCPPGDPNCPLPREPEVTEAGTGATAGGNVHNVLHLGLLLSSPKGNALHEANNQAVPSPLRTSPVKDEK